MEQNEQSIEDRTRDRIRGCLMAGAAGDALGYTVEFMRDRRIREKYGPEGIGTFELSPEGKALISDDTQMTLFTACGMLLGITRGCMRGIGGLPEMYVMCAYGDWYYTQTGGFPKDVDHRFTWLCDVPELYHRRAPGGTCMRACADFLNHREVKNDSKGCGGIMRVAPMALLRAGYWARMGSCPYDRAEMDEAGAVVAEATHLHPLGFLPAAALTHLIYSVATKSTDEAVRHISSLALESAMALKDVRPGKHPNAKKYVLELTEKAIVLAGNDKSDIENIRSIGEGWVAEETWAIAVYCAVRHSDSVADAIRAAVNHDGDSDSTGAVCGNIMGAIYGYEAIRRERLFCPGGMRLEETLELSDITLEIADDLFTSCIISEYDPIDTPEKERWFTKYYYMRRAD